MDNQLLEIKDKVLAAIGDLLGDYTVPTQSGNVITKAIAVLPHADKAYDYPTEGTGLKGLECVILPTNRTNDPILEGQIVAKTYLILLFQRDKNKDAAEPVDRLLATDLQIIPNGVNINFELPKSKTYNVAAITLRYFYQIKVSG